MALLFYFLIIIGVLLILGDAKKPSHFPPGPSWLPILGNIPLVLGLKKRFKFHHSIWANLSQKYGPVVGLRVGRDRLVIVSGRDAIRKFYSLPEFDGRPDGFFFRVRSFDKRLGLVFVDGPLQEEQRLFTIRALKQLGYGMTAMATTIENEAADLVRLFRDRAKRRVRVLMNDAFDVSMVNLIWTLVAGYRWDLEDERLNSLKKFIHESFHIIDLSGGILNQFPAIRHLFPKASGFEPLVNALKPLWQFLGDSITEIDENYDREATPKSLIEFFLQEMDAENPGKSFIADQLLCSVLDLFQAGTETTSNSLVFGLIYMVNYPRVAEKVRRELMDVVGEGNLPKLIHRSQMPYTICVINEILRLSSVAPLALVHRALKDVAFGEHIIRKDTLALVSLHSLHMDRSYWGDPEVFRPERFMDENGNLVQHEQNFLPFGHGRRKCIGENMAKSNLFLFFASFMHTFEMECEGGSLPDMEGVDGITIAPKPFWVRLKERN